MNTRYFITKQVGILGSQTAVARKTGVSQGTINKIVHGDTQSDIGTIIKIARAYNIPLSEFLSDAPELGKNPSIGADEMRAIVQQELAVLKQELAVLKQELTALFTSKPSIQPGNQVDPLTAARRKSMAKAAIAEAMVKKALRTERKRMAA
jgi:transcriptional regulator with XRE-family HTH domain